MYNLIILGEQHNFSTLEIENLQKYFLSINFIKYDEVDTKKVIQHIYSIINQKEKTIIVLNTKASVPNDLINSLTHLTGADTKYFSIESFMEKYLCKCYIPSKLTDISFLEKIRVFTWFQYTQKRIIDYLSISIIILLTFPFMLYSIYRIKKESSGPILFKQTRIGLNGKKFTCIKFRSMNEHSYHDPYTRENDSRIFPWGLIMRETRIDELPQLWNIFKGDMHLIAPRAEWNILVEKYETEIPYYNSRHIIKPGITGWAQVNYPYGTNIEDTKQKLMFDLYYIKHWSLLLEIKTIWKTIIVIFKRKGI